MIIKIITTLRDKRKRKKKNISAIKVANNETRNKKKKGLELKNIFELFLKRNTQN